MDHLFWIFINILEDGANCAEGGDSAYEAYSKTMRQNGMKPSDFLEKLKQHPHQNARLKKFIAHLEKKCPELTFDYYSHPNQ